MLCATGFVGEVLPGVAAQLMGAQVQAAPSVDARASPPRARHGTTQQIVGALLRPACRTAILANVFDDEQKTSRRDTGAGSQASMPPNQATASHEWGRAVAPSILQRARACFVGLLKRPCFDMTVRDQPVVCIQLLT